MYFLGLKRICDFDKVTLMTLDKLLLQFYQKNIYFTHETLKNELDLTAERAFDLTIRIEETGLISRRYVGQCQYCGNLKQLKKIQTCSKCHSDKLDYGYYFTMN